MNLFVPVIEYTVSWGCLNVVLTLSSRCVKTVHERPRVGQQSWVTGAAGVLEGVGAVLCVRLQPHHEETRVRRRRRRRARLTGSLRKCLSRDSVLCSSSKFFSSNGLLREVNDVNKMNDCLQAELQVSERREEV